MKHTEKLSQARLRACLAGHPWQDRIVLLDTVDSTSTYAKKLTAEGAPHGTVVLANHQTGGRGRLGRSFSSPEGLGLYCSVILRFSAAPAQLLHLTPLAAVAAVHAVEAAAGISPDIKWINDLIAERKKLGGILTELVLRQQETVCVVGIGINCRQQAEDFPPDVRQMAVSLRQLGLPVERERLAAALIMQLGRMAEACVSDPAEWMAVYRSKCITIGQNVQLLQNGNVREAFAEDVDESGALMVRFPDGTAERVFSGEASVRGMYGYV